MESLKGFSRIIKQIRGTENIFGYGNTATNQLFLLYCFCGKIFFTDKIHKSVKYFWIVLHSSGMLLGIVLGIMYVCQDMQKNLWTHLNVLNFVAISIFLGLYIPIGLYYYANDVEKTIDMIDELITSEALNDNIDVMKIILTEFSFPFASGLIYMCAGIVDVMVFYEEEKLKNYMYYTYPFPELEDNGNITFFLASNIICNLIFGFLLFEWLAAAAFILVWRTCCYNAFSSVRDEIYSRTKLIENEMLTSGSTSIDEIFKQTVINGTKAFKRITSIIDNSRRFIEFLYSIAVLGSFFGEAIQIYVILATEMPFSMKLKGIAYLTGLGWTIFLLFWIGETLRTAILRKIPFGLIRRYYVIIKASSVSFSVYSTPWYISVKNRAEVQIFLVQTQTMKNLSILSVYPLLCGTFSRYLHGISSYVNFLRNVTKK